MANLNKFGVPVGGTTSTVLMPKLTYRFRVTFNNIGGQADSKTLTHQIVSVTRPTLSHEPVTLDVYNSRVYLAGKHTWEAITITVRDDVENNVSRNYHGYEIEEDKRVVISTWQSLYKLPKTFFADFGAVIGDEAHLFKAVSLTKIMTKLTDC